MRLEPPPHAARALARHSEVLFRRRPDRDAPGGDVTMHAEGAASTNPRAGALALAARRIARELVPGLSRLLGGPPPVVTSAVPVAATSADLAVIAGPLAGNSVFAAGAAQFVTIVEAPALFRMLDRAFGGRGDVPDPLPSALPLSSQLLIERIEAAITGALGVALGLAATDVPSALRRDGDLAQVSPFAGDDPLWLFRFSIAETRCASWQMTLAFGEAALAAVFGLDTATPPRKPLASDPCAAPFADMPLPLTARLVDMAMPLARLSQLRVGDVLPVAVARQVPLHLGDRASSPIARGSIGALDDRVAVQLTEAFR